MQCIFDIEQQEWIVNYALTGDGGAIGSERCYKRQWNPKRKYLEINLRLEHPLLFS